MTDLEKGMKETKLQIWVKKCELSCIFLPLTLWLSLTMNHGCTVHNIVFLTMSSNDEETTTAKPKESKSLNQTENVNKPKRFEEIINQSHLNVGNPIINLPDEVRAYIAIIEPKLCRTLLKELASFLPLIKIEEKRKMMKKLFTISDTTNNEIGKIQDNSCNTNEKNNNDHYDESDYWNDCIALGHLRRVRRQQQQHISKVNPSSSSSSSPTRTEPPTKRSKKSDKNTSENNSAAIQLEVLVGSVVEIDRLLQYASRNDENNKNNSTAKNHNDDDHNQLNDLQKSLQLKGAKLQTLIEKYKLQLTERKLPGRPAKSQLELNQWNNSNWWPTLYFDKQSEEFKEKELDLDINEEYGIMTEGMIAAINDAKKHIEFENQIGSLSFCNREESPLYGAVIMCPVEKKVISSSFQEMNTIIQENRLKNTDNSDSTDEGKSKIIQLLFENPLNTPVLYAVQGVSRSERAAAIGLGMHNNAFKNNQVNRINLSFSVFD